MDEGSDTIKNDMWTYFFASGLGPEALSIELESKLSFMVMGSVKGLL